MTGTPGFSRRTARLWTRIAAGVAIIFGLATIREGGSVLFGNETAVRAAGRYVPFVLWFNTAAGFAYVTAGIGLWRQRRWAVALSVALAAATLAVFAAFGVHIASGGEYERRTIVAMSLRSAVWLVIALLVYRLVWKPQGRAGP